MSLLRSAIHIAMVTAGTVLMVTGCAAPNEPEPRPSAPEENFQPPAEPIKFYPEGSADENLPFFDETLRGFSAGAEPVQGVAVVEAVAAAGFDKTAMQVSFDESKTGLIADSIFVSVRIAADCLIGQIVSADRSAATYVVPAIGPDETICLIGDTRVIDW